MKKHASLFALALAGALLLAACGKEDPEPGTPFHFRIDFASSNPAGYFQVLVLSDSTGQIIRAKRIFSSWNFYDTLQLAAEHWRPEFDVTLVRYSPNFSDVFVRSWLRVRDNQHVQSSQADANHLVSHAVRYAVTGAPAIDSALLPFRPYLAAQTPGLVDEGNALVYAGQAVKGSWYALMRLRAAGETGYRYKLFPYQTTYYSTAIDTADWTEFKPETHFRTLTFPSAERWNWEIDALETTGASGKYTPLDRPRTDTAWHPEVLPARTSTDFAVPDELLDKPLRVGIWRTGYSAQRVFAPGAALEFAAPGFDVADATFTPATGVFTVTSSGQFDQLEVRLGDEISTSWFITAPATALDQWTAPALSQVIPGFPPLTRFAGPIDVEAEEFEAYTFDEVRDGKPWRDYGGAFTNYVLARAGLVRISRKY